MSHGWKLLCCGIYSIQILFYCSLQGFKWFWFLDLKYFTYPPNCFATWSEILLSLDWEQPFNNNFAVATEIIFFGGLRFLLLMHLEVQCMRIASDWNSTVLYVMLQYFSACCWPNGSKQTYLLIIIAFFNSYLQGTNFDITTECFYSKEVVVLQVLLLTKHISTQTSLSKFWSMGERYISYG